jgi:hypothetical protein
MGQWLVSGASIPKVLYHSVRSGAAMDFIRNNGIKADKDGFVYLSTRPIKTPVYKYCVEVRVPHENKLHDWKEAWGEGYDKQYDPSNPYYVYEGNIPKEYLKELQ